MVFYTVVSLGLVVDTLFIVLLNVFNAQDKLDKIVTLYQVSSGIAACFALYLSIAYGRALCLLSNALTSDNKNANG